jgi:hypothetical protein
VVQFELILGGAAVHRCGNCTILNAALAAEGRQFSNCVTIEKQIFGKFAD